MGKAAVVLAVLVVGLLPQVGQAADLQAGSVPISESSYVKIFNFSGWYRADADGWPQVQWTGFDLGSANHYVSTPTIEARLVNSKKPSLPPSQQPEDNALLFDCHTGEAHIGEFAGAAPVVMCGEEPWYHAEFDWVANIDSGAASHLRIEVTGQSYATVQTVWHLLPGEGLHAGHAAIDFSYIPNLGLSVVVVPEASGACVLVSGMGVLFGLAGRRKR